ncbi:unnamed protein product [Effrenium voratum]|nr:unnamed protein product [Effrenium voratum]
MYPGSRRERPRLDLRSGKGVSRSASSPILSKQSQAGEDQEDANVPAWASPMDASEPAREFGRDSALGGYLRLQEKKEELKLKAWLAMPAHLRPAPSPTEMGCMPNYVTEMARGLKLPVQMAVDPKWSTDLKNLNAKVGACIKYQNNLSSSVPGQMSPELPFMWKKDYLSNPPTPHFVAGRRPLHPADRPMH